MALENVARLEERKREDDTEKELGKRERNREGGRREKERLIERFETNHH